MSKPTDLVQGTLDLLILRVHSGSPVGRNLADCQAGLRTPGAIRTA